jgi:hypothetical protein
MKMLLKLKEQYFKTMLLYLYGGIDISKLPKEIKSNKNLMLIGIKKDGRGLQYVNEELKNDKDIVMAAVSNYGGALNYASEELKNNREVVLVAMVNDVISLIYASEQLQNDKDLLLLLEKDNNEAIKHYSIWYKKRMRVLDYYKEQDVIREAVKEIKNEKKVKVTKF